MTAPNRSQFIGSTSTETATSTTSSVLDVSIIFDPDTEGGGGSTRTFRGTSVEVLCAWTEAVNDFVEADVGLTWYDANGLMGSIEMGSFTGGNGDRSFRFRLELPDTSSGEVDITIAANTARASADVAAMVADVIRTGPPRAVTATLIYDTTTGAAGPPTVNIVDPAPLPWRIQQLPLTLQWTQEVSGFVLGDITASVGTLSDFVEVAGDEYTVLLTLPANMMGDVTLTIAADAAQGTTEAGPETDYSETFAYDTRGPDKNIPGTVTLCEETYTFANNPHFTGAFCNVLEMLVHNGYVYWIVQFIRDRGSTPTNFLAWDTRGASALFRVAVGGGSCERLAVFDDVLAGARSLCVFDGMVHYFRGSHYLYQFEDAIRPDSNADWRQQVGEIWKLENGTTPKLVGKTGRTGQEQLSRPGEDDYNPFYGIRGGTVSPLVPSNDELYYLTGWGDTRELGANLIANKDADDIRNWTLAKLSETLETRIPVLETNDHPGWENVKQLSQLTRSRVGFRGEQFRWEPTAGCDGKNQDGCDGYGDDVGIEGFYAVECTQQWYSVYPRGINHVYGYQFGDTHRFDARGV